MFLGSIIADRVTVPPELQCISIQLLGYRRFSVGNTGWWICDLPAVFESLGSDLAAVSIRGR